MRASAEAIRLARLLHRLLPGMARSAGLLALMLLTDARRPARTRPTVTWSRSPSRTAARWDAAAIAEGVALITDAMPRGAVGPYQLQAAIAAVHDEAPAHGGHRLAADPRALRPAGEGRAESDGDAEPRRCGRYGARTRGRAGAGRVSGVRRPDGAQPPAPGDPGASQGAGRRSRRRLVRLPGGRAAHGQRPRAAVPQRPRRRLSRRAPGPAVGWPGDRCAAQSRMRRTRPSPAPKPKP